MNSPNVRRNTKRRMVADIGRSLRRTVLGIGPDRYWLVLFGPFALLSSSFSSVQPCPVRQVAPR